MKRCAWCNGLLWPWSGGVTFPSGRAEHMDCHSERDADPGQRAAYRVLAGTLAPLVNALKPWLKEHKYHGWAENENQAYNIARDMLLPIVGKALTEARAAERRGWIATLTAVCAGVVFVLGCWFYGPVIVSAIVRLIGMHGVP